MRESDKDDEKDAKAELEMMIMDCSGIFRAQIVQHRDNVEIMDEKQYNTTSTAMLSQRQAAESSAERMKIVN